MARSGIAENATIISQNYNSSFLVNRRIANENTDALFRTRIGILQCLPTNDQESGNYRDAQINKAKISFLEFRNRVNEQSVLITRELAELNAKAIAINRKIIESNDEISKFNEQMLSENNVLLMTTKTDEPETQPVNAEEVVQQDNSFLEPTSSIVENTALAIRDLRTFSTSNSNAIDELLALSETNRAQANMNAQVITFYFLMDLINSE